MNGGIIFNTKKLFLSSLCAVHIQTNNTEAGRQAGRYVASC
jgi:hypothetical protein